MLSTKFRLIAILLFVVVLSACNSAGDAGNGTKYTVNVTPSAISFQAKAGGGIPASQTASINFNGAGLLVGYLPDTIAPSWLNISAPSRITASPVAVTFAITDTNLSAGSYSTVIRFVTGNIEATQGTIKDIPLNFTISDPSPNSDILTVSDSNLGFSAEIGATNQPVSQLIGITAPNSAWTAATKENWITLGQASGVGSQDVSISVDTRGLSAGNHVGQISFIDNTSKTEVIVNVSLTITVPSVLATNIDQLNFDYLLGNETLPNPMMFGISGGSIPWTVESNGAWLLVDKTSGMGAADITVNIEPTGLATGDYNGKISITNTDSGAVVVVGVSLTITTPSLVASQSEIIFNAINGTTITPSLIDLAADNGQAITWTATSKQNWISLNGVGGSTTGGTVDPLNIGIEATTSNLASGNHTGSVKVSAMVAGRVSSTTINVNLSLTPATLSFSATEIAFAGINGAEMPANSLEVSLNTGENAYPWNMTITADDGKGGLWLLSDGLSGMVSATISTQSRPTLSVDASQLASANYNGAIEFQSQVNGDLITATLPISLSLSKATLSLSATSADFTGVNSTDLGTTTFTASLNTGALDYPWTAIISASDGGNGVWLVTDNASGRISDTAPVSLLLSIDTSVILGGNYAGDITLQAQVNGDLVTETFLVNLNLEPHRLFIADNGVALSGFPTVTAGLSYTVTVTENAGTATVWTASSDQAWLNVTGTGNTDGMLTLSANTTGISTDIIQFATVTVSSTNSTIENSELIRVGLWASSTDPSNPAPITTAYSQITSDPIRPYVYVHNNAADIDIYNVHTGTLVSTISAVGASLGDMEVSSDGSTLYVADNTNFDIIPIDLNTLSTLPLWNLDKTTAINFAYTRPNGMPVLIVDDRSIRDATSGSPLGPTFNGTYYGTQILTASLHANKFCGINSGLSPYTITCYNTSYSFLNGGEFTLSTVGSGEFGVGSNGQDVALSADGAMVYAASGAPYKFIVYDGDTMLQKQSLPADAYPNNVEIGSNGLLYGGISGGRGPTDVWVYNSKGVEQYRAYVSGNAQNILGRQLVVSGDGSKMAVLTSDPTLQFLTVP